MTKDTVQRSMRTFYEVVYIVVQIKQETGITCNPRRFFSFFVGDSKLQYRMAFEMLGNWEFIRRTGQNEKGFIKIPSPFPFSCRSSDFTVFHFGGRTGRYFIKQDC